MPKKKTTKKNDSSALESYISKSTIVGAPEESISVESGGLEEKYNFIAKEYERLAKEVDSQKGYLIFGVIILLIMVAQMLVDLFGIKIQSLGNVENQLNQQNVEFTKLNTNFNNLFEQLNKQQSKIQTETISTTPR